MALILADTRENNGANPYLEVVCDENNKKNIKLQEKAGGGIIIFEIKQITVGDYCILLKDKNTSNTKLAMVIERKTWKDLAASIKDNRINTQHKKLIDIKNKYNCCLLFIIEGKMTYKDDSDIGNIPFKNLHAKLRHIMIRGIPFLQSKDQQHTAKMIVDLARDLMKMYNSEELDFKVAFDIENEKKRGSNENKKEENNNNNKKEENNNNNKKEENNNNNKKEENKKEENNNNKKEENNNNKKEENNNNKKEENKEDGKEELDFEPVKEEKDDFNIPIELKTLKKLEDSDIVLKMWSSIPGVSDKSAIIIMQNFHCSDFICANSDELLILKKKLSELKHASGTKFGEVKATNVLGITNNTETRIKFIAEIDRLSELAAKAILETFSLRDICNGFVKVEDIANIKNKNNKKLGIKIANKVLKILLKPSLLPMYNL